MDPKSQLFGQFIAVSLSLLLIYHYTANYDDQFKTERNLLSEDHQETATSWLAKLIYDNDDQIVMIMVGDGWIHGCYDNEEVVESWNYRDEQEKNNLIIFMKENGWREKGNNNPRIFLPAAREDFASVLNSTIQQRTRIDPEDFQEKAGLHGRQSRKKLVAAKSQKKKKSEVMRTVTEEKHKDPTTHWFKTQAANPKVALITVLIPKSTEHQKCLCSDALKDGELDEIDCTETNCGEYQFDSSRISKMLGKDWKYFGCDDDKKEWVGTGGKMYKFGRKAKLSKTKKAFEQWSNSQTAMRTDDPTTHWFKTQATNPEAVLITIVIPNSTEHQICSCSNALRVGKLVELDCDAPRFRTEDKAFGCDWAQIEQILGDQWKYFESDDDGKWVPNGSQLYKFGRKERLNETKCAYKRFCDTVSECPHLFKA